MIIEQIHTLVRTTFQSSNAVLSFAISRLVRSIESPLKSPVRTPVTENDPLGALLNDETPVVSPSGENDSNCSTSTLTILNSVTEERAGGPLLFRR